MIKFSELVKNQSIIDDFSYKKGYRKKVIENYFDKDGNPQEREIDNPQSTSDFFNEYLKGHIEYIVNEYRKEKAVSELKLEKAEL